MAVHGSVEPEPRVPRLRKLRYSKRRMAERIAALDSAENARTKETGRAEYGEKGIAGDTDMLEFELENQSKLPITEVNEIGDGWEEVVADDCLQEEWSIYRSLKSTFTSSRAFFTTELGLSTTDGGKQSAIVDDLNLGTAMDKQADEDIEMDLDSSNQLLCSYQ